MSTVTVACKLPNGIFMEVKTLGHPLCGQVHEIRGSAVPVGSVPPVDGGTQYALTPNVPEDLWLQWQLENKDSLLVKNKYIFSSVNNREARAESRDKTERGIRADGGGKKTVADFFGMMPDKPGNGVERMDD